LKPIEPAGPTELTNAYPGKNRAFPLSAAGLSFDAILTETCGRLEDRRNRSFVKRIHRMEETLENIERDLNEFLAAAAANYAGATFDGADSAGTEGGL
jgi:hypothetical protein